MEGRNRVSRGGFKIDLVALMRDFTRAEREIASVAAFPRDDMEGVGLKVESA
jgi:hypothetical protein